MAVVVTRRQMVTPRARAYGGRGDRFQRINAIVKGRRAVSADTALLLEALTGWDAQIWLTLQAKWDLWHALRARGRRPKAKPLRTALAHAR